MSDFISKELQKQTIAPETYDSKIVLFKNEVNIQYVNSRDTGPEFKLYYLVNLSIKGRRLDPKTVLSPRTIDMKSLEDGIYSNLKSFDSRYLVLSKFDDRRAEFVFDHERWLKDATSGMKGKTSFSKFDREFRFKIKLPFELSKDANGYSFNKFITRKFLDWLETNQSKQRNFFDYLIPASQQRSIRNNLRGMFDWSYNQQWNYIQAKLKSVYVIALLFATGAAVDKLKTSNLRDKELFATKVKDNIHKFDAAKWKKFVGTKIF